MTISFNNLIFIIEDCKIYLKKFCGLEIDSRHGFIEVQIAGENKDTHLGVKTANSSEGGRLQYVSHSVKSNVLTIIQKSDLIEVKTVFTAYDDTNAVRIYTEVKNISGENIVLEEVSAISFYGIGKNGEEKVLFFTRFTQSHHYECQPIRRSFSDYILSATNGNSQKSIKFANIGSWSTKEELPQGIIENSASNEYLMFQIESNNSWYYEIGDSCGKYYLYLGGANVNNGSWYKELKPNETYKTVNVALSFGGSFNEVICEMTKYRRHIAGKCVADEKLPVIFNEYMHLSWDSPDEENTRRIAPLVAKTGASYYVIDCGWHDEEDGNIIYPYVGKWKESKKRFPHGVRATTDYIRSLGLRAGLWIEPEIIGVKCSEMLAYYDDDCFISRFGKKIAVMGRYFLDFRNQKVRDYMTDTIRRMVEEYGAEYIKLDYNQDFGIGTDKYGTSFGEGLELCAKAYLNWIASIKKLFPNVLFETCSSGGMRMDYETLSHFSIVSTSDQTDYLKYPYIAGNILSAVLPEQAAVWSYPVGVGEIGKPLPYDAKWMKENIKDEQIVMNMINSFLGRMHLASHLELLTKDQFLLVQEGVEYYKVLTEAKKKATPYFPIGVTRFGADLVAGGFKTDEKIYLAVWNLSSRGREINIPLNTCKVREAVITYPKNCSTEFALGESDIIINFEKGYSARFFEIKQ